MNAELYSTDSPAPKQSTKQEIAQQLLALIEVFRMAHQDEEGFRPGQVVDRALNVVTFNAQYDAEYGEK